MCLEVGEAGWSVWAAGICFLWVGKKSTFQEPASTEFLCEHCFLELLPERDIIFCIHCGFKVELTALQFLISHCAVKANTQQLSNISNHKKSMR